LVETFLWPANKPLFREWYVRGVNTTLPETNSHFAPENRPLEKEIPIPPCFGVFAVSFREGKRSDFFKNTLRIMDPAGVYRFSKSPVLRGQDT